MNLKGTESGGGDKTITIIKYILKLTYVENPGMAFGIRLGDVTFFIILSRTDFLLSSPKSNPLRLITIFIFSIKELAK